MCIHVTDTDQNINKMFCKANAISSDIKIMEMTKPFFLFVKSYLVFLNSGELGDLIAFI